MSNDNTPVEGEVDNIQAEDYSREARIQGWVPAEQFRGREEDWVDAETFVKRGRELNPILRANNRRLLAQVEQLSTAQKETEAAIAQFRQHHEETEARAYAKAVRDLKAQRKQALLDGDNAAALEAEEAIESLDTEMYETTQARRTAKPTTTVKAGQDGAASVVTHGDIKDFSDRNPWFSKDRVKTQIALALGEQLHSEAPALMGAQFLAELETRLEDEFPQQFGNPKRSRGSNVEGSGAGGKSSGKGGKSAADLPPEARAAMARFVKAKLMTEKQYIADYFGAE